VASTIPALNPKRTEQRHNIIKLLEKEKPKSAVAIIDTLTNVIMPVLNRLLTHALNMLERIVPPVIIIEIIPTLSIDTPKLSYMDGHALPNGDLDKPKLINTE